MASPSIDLEEIERVMAEADCLCSEEDVEGAIDRMAAEITIRLAAACPLVYAVMKGGMVIGGKLLPKLRFPLEADYLHATRYGDRLYGDELHWEVRPCRDMSGRTVLLIDDILDEGATLAGIIDYCLDQGAEKVLTAVLVEKEHDRKVRGLTGDFVGLRLEDRYLFGYGMDYKGYWRNAPGIYALKG